MYFLVFSAALSFAWHWECNEEDSTCNWCCIGVEMPHRGALLPVPMLKPTPSSHFPEHHTRPQCAGAVSAPALQHSKRLSACGIYGKEPSHSPMFYAFPQGWVWNLSGSAWVVKKFILLLTVSPGLPRREVGLLWCLLLCSCHLSQKQALDLIGLLSLQLRL